MRQLSLIAVLSALAMPVVADDAAVLLGVDRYDALRRVNDATDILAAADALQDAGYDVSTLSNGSAGDMNRLLADLADTASSGDRLIVALAGRFATDGTRSWFLAKDTEAPAPFAMNNAISIDTVMQVLANSPGQAILVLGYGQSSFGSFGRYLREGVGNLDVPQGVTVIYGEPDDVDNVLTDAIAEPGQNVMGFVRDSRRLNTLGFRPESLVMQPTGSTRGVVTPAVDPSLTAWNNAQLGNTIAGYRDFLSAYPRSPFSQEALRRISELELDPVRVAQLSEEALNLTRNERRTIQQNLTLLDYNTRGVDGIFGPGTRGAIRNWQQSNGFAQTSYLTASQINRIDGQASRRAAELAVEEERAREEALRLDREYWEETGARGGQAGYRAYLDRYPEGIFAQEAQSKLTVPVEVDSRAAREAEEALNINPVLRRLIESRLAGLGYEPGDIDGRFDRNSRRAIAAYQAQRNLSSTGYIDQPTLARLLADTIGR